MNTPVHILATVRKPELLEAALLVFRTLRVGFPAAEICVWGNALDHHSSAWLNKVTNDVAGKFCNLPPTSHDCWIDGLINRSFEPFWICDTDVVFFDPVESWFDPRFIKPETETLFAGRFEPEFDEQWTGTRHAARLHTALMYFNPAPLRTAMREWICRFPLPWRNSAQFLFVHQHFIPVAGGKPLFYDTCAGLHQALQGTAFTEQQNKAFEHLHCATYADLIAEEKSLSDLPTVHQAVYQNPNAARGLQKAQADYYQKFKPKQKGAHV